MVYSAQLFGLLVGAGLLLGAGIAIVAERHRMVRARSMLFILVVCLVVLLIFNAPPVELTTVEALTGALLLSLLELPVLAVPSIIAMLVVRKALRKRDRTDVH